MHAFFGLDPRGQFWADEDWFDLTCFGRNPIWALKHEAFC